jgi:hypothetical protein
MYKLIKNYNGTIDTVQRVADNTFIPFAQDNSDYQAYLAWIAEGNTPLPADEVNHGTN